MSIEVLRPTAVVVSVDDPNGTPPPQDAMTDHHENMTPGPTHHNLDQIGRTILASEFLLRLT